MDSISTMDIRLAQQAFDIAVLGLWAHAKKTTGHTHETIRAFTFRPEFLTPEQKRENQQAARYRKPPVYCDKNWHNALRLRDETVIGMPGIKRPILPAWFNTEVRKRIGL